MDRSFKFLAYYIASALFITVAYVSSFPSFDTFLSFLGLSTEGSSINIAFLGVNIAPAIVLTYFFTTEGMREYLLGEREKIQNLIKRGVHKKGLLLTYLPKLLLLGVGGLVVGNILTVLLFVERSLYAPQLFVPEFLLSQHQTNTFTFDPASSIAVVLAGLLFLTFSLRHLLALSRPEEFQRDHDSARKENGHGLSWLGLNTLLVVISFFMLFELLNREVEVVHPLIVVIVIVSVVVLLLSSQQVCISLVDLTILTTFKRFDKLKNEEVRGVEHTTQVLKMLLAWVVVPGSLFLALYLVGKEINVAPYLWLVVLAVVVYGASFLLIMLSRPVLAHLSLLRLQVTGLRRHANLKLFGFFVLMFTIIAWQGTSYSTVGNAGIQDAYFQNYGADITVAVDYQALLDPISLNEPWDVEESVGLLENRSADIQAVLRYFINKGLAVAPTADTSMDIIMFDTVSYVENGFYFQDEWFEGGTAEEIFTSLSTNATKTIVLDKTYAERLNKGVGDSITLNPILRPGTRSWEMTVVGLVDYFPSDTTGKFNPSGAAYRPFAIMDIKGATRQFQDPGGPLNPVDRGLTNMFLVKTTERADRPFVLDEIFEVNEDPSLRVEHIYQFDSTVLDDFVGSSNYFGQVLPYMRALGVAQASMVIITVLFGTQLLLQSQKMPKKKLLAATGLREGFFPTALLHYQLISSSVALAFGAVTGTVLTNTLSKLVLPPTSHPVVPDFTSYSPVLASFVLLLCVMTILWLMGRIMGHLDEAKKYFGLVLPLLTTILLPSIAVLEPALHFFNSLPSAGAPLVVGGVLGICLVLKLGVWLVGVTPPEKPMQLLSNIAAGFLFLALSLVGASAFLGWIDVSTILPWFSLVLPLLILAGMTLLTIWFLVRGRGYVGNWLVFSTLSLKKLRQNRSRIAVLLSGLTLALALVAGVSTHVDSVSQTVVDGYFNDPARQTDLFVDLGLATVEDAQEFLEDNQTQEEFPWVDDYSFGHRWHIYGIHDYKTDGDTPRWDTDPNYDHTGSVVPLLSVYDDFEQFFGGQIIMEEGVFDIGPDKVVVTPRFATTFFDRSNVVGDQISLFEWMYVTAAIASPAFDFLKQTNWTSPILTITGVMSDQSPILEFLTDLGPNYPGYNFMDIFGVAVMQVTNETMPSFWNELRFQPGNVGCPDCASFDSFVNVRVDESQIDQINPASFIPEITRFGTEVVNFFGATGRHTTWISPLQGILDDWVEWTITTRALLIFLSTPIIFLGFYLADYTFKQIYRERRKEISSLKSRGVTNNQVIGVLYLEVTVLLALGLTAGLTLGYLSNALYGELLPSSDELKVVVSPLTVVLTALFGAFITIFGSYRPVRRVLNWPIDEILATEHERGQQETNGHIDSYHVLRLFMVGLVGLALLVSVGTLPSDLQTENFTIVLAIIGIGAIFVGLINAMAEVARVIPIFLELTLKVGRQSTQWFLVAREMARHQKATIAAFVVISLTLGFGIISAVVVESSNDYYQRDAFVEVGTDLQFRVIEGRENSYTEQFESIPSNLSALAGVEGVSQYYRARGYILPTQDQENFNPQYPSLTTYYMAFTFGLVEEAQIVFVDPATYFDTALLMDTFFVDSTVAEVKERFESVYDAYVQSPDQVFCPVIIDEETANRYSLETDDFISFASARLQILEGQGTVVGVAKALPPGITGPFVVLPYLVDMASYYSTPHPSSGFMVNLEEEVSPDTIINQVVGNTDYYAIRDGFTPEDYLSDKDVTRDLDTLTQILNLNFLYSVTLAGLGFLLILEFRTNQKAREIGVLKALGVRRRGVVGLVTLEAVIIIVVAMATAALIGIVGAYSIIQVLPNLRVEKQMMVPGFILLLEVAVAMAMALAGTLIAALRANRHEISLLLK